MVEVRDHASAMVMQGWQPGLVTATSPRVRVQLLGRPAGATTSASRDLEEATRVASDDASTVRDEDPSRRVPTEQLPIGKVFDDVRPLVPAQSSMSAPSSGLHHPPTSPSRLHPARGWSLGVGPGADDEPLLDHENGWWSEDGRQSLGQPWEASDADLVEAMRLQLVEAVGFAADDIEVSHWRRQVETACWQRHGDGGVGDGGVGGGGVGLHKVDEECVQGTIGSRPAFHADYYGVADYQFTGILYLSTAGDGGAAGDDGAAGVGGVGGAGGAGRAGNGQSGTGSGHKAEEGGLIGGWTAFVDDGNQDGATATSGDGSTDHDAASTEAAPDGGASTSQATRTPLRRLPDDPQGPPRLSGESGEGGAAQRRPPPIEAVGENRFILRRGLLVAPKPGRLVLFSGGGENYHSALPVARGRRHSLQAWFKCTCDQPLLTLPSAATGVPPLTGASQASTSAHASAHSPAGRASKCEPWCVHPCTELGGDVKLECGGCVAISAACHPGAEGFGRGSSIQDEAASVPSESSSAAHVDMQYQVSALGATASTMMRKSAGASPEYGL